MDSSCDIICDESGILVIHRNDIILGKRIKFGCYIRNNPVPVLIIETVDYITYLFF